MRALLLASLAAAAAALYDASDDVIQLTDKDFDKRVLKDSGVWLVEVYAPWCGHCKNLAPEWKKAAKALKGIVNVAAVDGTAAQAVSQRLGVKGFPTIFVYGADKAKPTTYNGGRDAKSIVDAALREVGAVAQRRLSGKAAPGGGSGSGGGAKGGASGGAKKGGNKASDNEPGGGKHVVALTDDDFEDTVLASDDAWMVEFYAPWCGHCKTLAPEWAEAAAQTADLGGVRFAAVDATVHQKWAGQFNVRGFPTIISFPHGKKTAASGTPYQGGRSASDLIRHATALAEAGGPSKGAVAQLTTPDVWGEQCAGKRLCLLAVLPHLADDGAAKRQARLDVLADAAGAVGRRHLFRWLWAGAGDHPGLEGLLNVGVTPALYAISEDKRVLTPYLGALEAGKIKSFVDGLAAGRAAGARPFPAGTASAGSLLAAKGVEPWDGKDYRAGAGGAGGGDEFSLDDLDL